MSNMFFVFFHFSADYLIVTGHYPLFSAGVAGPTTECLRTRMQPMLELYRVNAYIAGHDHNVQVSILFSLIVMLRKHSSD